MKTAMPAHSNYNAKSNFVDESKNGRTIEKAAPTSGSERIKGFAAGTASGLTKLTIGHPFDTIKTRMQCSPPGTYRGPLHCLRDVIATEGPRALYKGASPPAVGWILSDAILLGSLHNYRLLLAKHTPLVRDSDSSEAAETRKLNVIGHATAGALAGLTVALVATPIELLKVQLQMQMNTMQNFHSSLSSKSYTSPLGFAKQIYAANGVLGFWHGVGATMSQRVWFGAMFSSYDLMMRYFRQPVTKSDGSHGPRLSESAANFVSGGLSSNVFWIFAFPFDTVKNRLMSDSISHPQYPTWRSAAIAIWREGGIRSVFRGFMPAFLRAFPTNGAALLVWESTMRLMDAQKVR